MESGNIYEKYEDFDKGEIISLISSITPSLEETLEYVDKGMMIFSGNQWNENWDWHREVLNRFPKNMLIELYEDLKAKYGISTSSDR